MNNQKRKQGTQMIAKRRKKFTNTIVASLLLSSAILPTSLTLADESHSSQALNTEPHTTIESNLTQSAESSETVVISDEPTSIPIATTEDTTVTETTVTEETSNDNSDEAITPEQKLAKAETERQMAPRAFVWELRADGYYYLEGYTGTNSRALDVNLTFVDEETGATVETQSYPKVHTSAGVFTDLENQNYQVSITDPFVDFGSQDSNGHYRGVAISGSDFTTDGKGNFNVTVKVQKLATGGTETPTTPETPQNVSVKVKHVDENGHEIASSTTFSGKVGQAYTVNDLAVSVNGYKVSKDQYPNANGTLQEGMSTISVYYDKVGGETPTDPETPVVPPIDPETPETPTDPETPTNPTDPETPVVPNASKGATITLKDKDGKELVKPLKLEGKIGEVKTVNFNTDFADVNGLAGYQLDMAHFESIGGKVVNGDPVLTVILSDKEQTFDVLFTVAGDNGNNGGGNGGNEDPNPTPTPEPTPTPDPTNGGTHPNNSNYISNKKDNDVTHNSSVKSNNTTKQDELPKTGEIKSNSPVLVGLIALSSSIFGIFYRKSLRK